MKKRYVILVTALLAVFTSLKGQEPELVNSLAKHVEILASDSLAGRSSNSLEKKMSVDYITGEFSKAGFSPYNGSYIQYFVLNKAMENGGGMNIAGVIEGSDPVLKNEYVIIGAHYDHLGWKTENGSRVVYNGADDNASGVAAIIEIGKQLLRQRSELKRSILIIAFDGEEEGLLGSEAFVNKDIRDFSKIKAMFSFDMVGMYSKNRGIDLYGLKSVKGGEAFIRDLVISQKLEIKEEKDKIENRTDTWSFAVKNIPAVCVTTGTLSPYHKPEDDSDLLDYEGMADVVNAMTVVVKELASRSSVDKNRNFLTRSVDPSFRAGLTIGIGGSHFEYKDQYYKGKQVLALSPGLVAQLRLSRRLTLQPVVTCDMAGSHAEEGKLRLFSVSPQVNILFSTLQGKPGMPSGYFFAGAYYRYNFSALVGHSGFDFGENYNVNDSGMNIGFGLQYMKTQFNYYMKYGMHKVNATSTNGDIYNTSYCISLTKFF